MVWTGGGGYRLAPALLTLFHQLQQAYPGPQWQGSPQTGTIGDAAHRAEASSDHNPWLDNTVRALDVAVNASGVTGIVTVTDGPPGAQIAAMVNALYAARDVRVYPNGYAIFNGRITDWDNPGQTKPYYGADQHRYHVHISVSQNPAGFNSAAPWPLPGPPTSPAESAESSTATPLATMEAGMFRLIRNVDNGVVRACGPGFWASIEGATPARTLALIELFRKDPMCASADVEDVGTARMQAYYDFYVKGKVA